MENNEKEFIDRLLKDVDVDHMNRRMVRFGGRKYQTDITKGCIPTNETQGEIGYVYLITYRDKHEDKRPEGFEFKFYDKKIGVAYDVEKRMKTLSDELKLGRKNVLKKRGTLTPLTAHSLKCWKMSLENSYFIEYYLHDILDKRNVEGEWFTDYDNDLINVMDYEMGRFVNNGADVEVLVLDEYMTENIHRFEKIIPTNVPKKEENIVLVYKL